MLQYDAASSIRTPGRHAFSPHLDMQEGELVALFPPLPGLVLSGHGDGRRLPAQQAAAQRGGRRLRLVRERRAVVPGGPRHVQHVDAEAEAEARDDLRGRHHGGVEGVTGEEGRDLEGG